MIMSIEKTPSMYPVNDERGIVKNIAQEGETGYISLFRSIRKHWIWQDAEKLKWWLDILLEVNHKPQKVLIGGKLIECKRGQSLNSLLTWAKRWRTNVSKVRRFLYLLKSDSMVVLENVSKTTRLTVCKYDSYQGRRNDNETEMNFKRNGSETQANTNNNDNNDNNSIGAIAPKPKSFKQWTETEFYNDIANNKGTYTKEMLRAFYDHWSEKSPSGKMLFQLKATWETKRRLVTWFKNEDRFGRSSKQDQPNGQMEKLSSKRFPIINIPE
jgi:hypothetical protein